MSDSQRNDDLTRERKIRALKTAKAEFQKAHADYCTKYAEHNKYIAEVDAALQNIDTALEAIDAQLAALTSGMAEARGEGEQGAGETSTPGYAQQEEGVEHASDCAVHNEPAFPNGECDCELGAVLEESGHIPVPGAGQESRDQLCSVRDCEIHEPQRKGATIMVKNNTPGGV